MRSLWMVLVAAGCLTPLANVDVPDLATAGPEPGMTGAPCSSDSQCNFGVCLAVGRCSHICPLPACENGWVCAPEGSRNVCQCPTVGVELCNGIDDDCNGLADDNAVCPGGGACVQGQCQCGNPLGANHSQAVAQQITMPQTRMQFAVDLNGDGKTDNQYGNIVAALSAQMLNPQTAVDEQVNGGKVLLLVDVRSMDPTFANDTCAGALVTYAKPTTPNFSGSGSFMVDSSLMSGDFSGAISASNFNSSTDKLVSLDVYLPLMTFASGIPAQKTRLTAARVRFNPKTGQGQLNGVIRKQDLDQTIAGTAALLDQRIQQDPSSATSQQIRQIFDTGGSPDASCAQGCRNPDGSCAKSGDGRIAACEVSTNPIIKNLLAPDVDLFDAAGNYAPNPANTDKDSLSVGFGFTTVGATF